MKWGEGMPGELTQHDLNVEKSIAALTEQMKAAFRRIDEQKELTETVHKMAVSMEYMAQEQARQRKKLEELEAKPGRRWETVVGQLISLGVAAGGGFFLSRWTGG